MNIPFACIRLHTRDRAVDADAVLNDAYTLGQEIARRWNAQAQEPPSTTVNAPQEPQPL